VAGATGALGGRLARDLHAEGARVALAGRDASRLTALAGDLDAPAVGLDLLDGASARRAVTEAAAALGGLDALVIATGAVAFGPADALDDEIARALFAVNVLGPMALIAESLPHLAEGGAVVALSAVVADFPTAGMAAYSASKAALSAYLTALRREVRRRRITVLDVRPPHIDTGLGLAGRALAGEPPPLGAGLDPEVLTAAVLAGMRDDAKVVAWDARARSLAVS
jgi:short-subunit dehydrogenase